MTWTAFEPYLYERLTAEIESKPEVLLEHDGGPEHLKADIILAVLYGIDGQQDALWRLREAEPFLLRAISRPPRISDFAAVATPDPGPTARYELQSSWASLTLDYLAHRDLLPPDVKPSIGTNQITVALLRYRHRI